MYALSGVFIAAFSLTGTDVSLWHALAFSLIGIGYNVLARLFVDHPRLRALSNAQWQVPFNVLNSVLFVLLHAPDVAMTEAAVGAGLSGVVLALGLRKLGLWRLEDDRGGAHPLVPTRERQEDRDA